MAKKGRGGRSHGRSFGESGSNPGRPTVDRKTGQLCRQVRDAICLALSASDNDVLRNLTVASVLPAPDAGRLLVMCYPPVGTVEPLPALAALDAHNPYFRNHVAEAISRRRVPHLSFTVLPSADAVEM